MAKYIVKKCNKDFKFILNEPVVRGSRKKILVITSQTKLAMFKYEKENYICSEACSEKMAYEIAKVLDYDCAKIELAIDADGNTGVLNYFFSDPYKKTHTDIVSFLNKNNVERNEFYTVSNIKNILDQLDSKLFKDFVKIMIFDALIGEQDRHEENWGVTLMEGKYTLSPLYDNADSLLRDFKNECVFEKYYNNTKSFDAYIKKSKTTIYKEDKSKKYKHFELITYLFDNYPNLVIPEIKNLVKLSDGNIRVIVDSIPDNLLTNKHKEYIIQYLIKRRNILLNMIKRGE